MIDQYLIQNNHKSFVEVVPVNGLTARSDKILQEKLQEYKNTLSEEEVKRIVKQTHDLEEYQETPSCEEDLKKIPLLTREDLKKETDRKSVV